MGNSKVTIAAFFDMDRTLLSDSSSFLMIRYLRDRGEISGREILRLLAVLLRYRLGILDIPTLTRRLVADLAGQREADRIAFSQRWFDEQLVYYVAARGREFLERHRQAGHRLALITASPNYTADPLAAYLQISPDDVLATRFEVQDGHFTGRVVEPLCFREGKLYWARRYAAAHGIDLSASYFYTDSIDDLPLLEAVGFPVAVNPDKPLRKLALRRGWPIVQFY